MDETKRGVVIVDILDQSDETEGFQIIASETVSKEENPSSKRGSPDLTLEIVPVAPVAKPTVSKKKLPPLN